MKTLLPSPVIYVFQATRTRLRVPVLLALLLALVLPTSGYAVPAGAAARHAFAGGIGIAAHPAGLAAAIARDLGPAAPAAAPDPQLQILTAADSAANAHFGIRVALSGDGNTALVGAPGKTVGSNAKAGAAYVYTNADGTWTQQQVLTAADGAANDGFGSSVALNGDGTFAVVGAFDKTITGHADAGAVYVLTRSDSGWAQQQELGDLLAENNDFFGAGVAVNSAGTTILVGASGATVGGNASEGEAFKYTRSGSTWSVTQELTAVDGAADDSFGISVALSSGGTTSLIGASGHHDSAGAVYVFNGSGITAIAATNAAAGDVFGDAVALSGDGKTALVGANGKSVGGHADAGAAYVLTFSGSTWTQQEITANDGAAFDHFGAAVALSGDGTAALVGAFGKAVGSNTGAGAVYGYTPSGGSWVLQKAAVDGAANGGFGISVALSSNGSTTSLVGAYGKTVGSNTGAGEVYVYSPPGASPSATPTPTAVSSATATGTATAAPSAPGATATSTGTASAATTATGTAAVTATATGTGVAAATPTASPGTGSPTTAYFAEGYTGTAAGNGRATFTETLNLLNPGTTPAPVTITYYVQGASAPMTITRTVSPTSVLRESVNSDVGADKVVAAQVTSPQRVYVTRTMTRTAPDGSRLDGSATLPVAAPATAWGFPEGYTGSTFQEYLTILNPNSSSAHVSILLAPQADTAAGAKTLTLTVPALSRSTANIRSLNQAGSAKSVGMLISSDQPIVPERVLYFGDGAGSGKFGSTVSSGSAGGAQQIYLAYGTSGGLTTSGGKAQCQRQSSLHHVAQPQHERDAGAGHRDLLRRRGAATRHPEGGARGTRHPPDHRGEPGARGQSGRRVQRAAHGDRTD